MMTHHFFSVVVVSFLRSVSVCEVQPAVVLPESKVMDARAQMKRARTATRGGESLLVHCSTIGIRGQVARTR
jgi:hypothetical protein